MTQFDALFEEEWKPDFDSKFGLSTVTCADIVHEDLVDALATWVADNKTDPTVTADLVAAAGWAVATAPLLAGRISVRRGDFGEVLAAEAIEAFDDLVIPIRKLRYQIDPNQTLPGSDIVAFELGDDGDLLGLHFCESKYRTKPGRGIMVEAIDQLDGDREREFATTINFLAHRLRETDTELYGRFLSYLRLRSERTDSFGVCLTCDETASTDGPVEAAADLPEVAEPLMLRVVPLPDTIALIDAVCARLNYELDTTDD